MRWLKAWTGRLAAVVAGVLFAELALSFAGLVSPRIAYQLSPPWRRVLLADAKLGYRMSPYYPGNDALGFRNRAVPETCELLAVGQSSTYGFGAGTEESWPRQLEALTGKSVYNMSCGGYGPCESSVLLERGLGLRPATVLVEFYANNDFVDAYQAVYPQHRFSELACGDEQLLGEMSSADATAPFPTTKVTADDEPTAKSMRDWITLHSSLYGLARELGQVYGATQYRSRIQGEYSADRDSFYAGEARASFLAFAPNRGQRTVFLPAGWYCLRCDFSDARVREGKRITEAVFESMQALLTAKGIRLVVVNIPTKMSAYKELAIAAKSDLPDAFFRGLELEERATADVRAFCVSRQMAWLDVTEAVREELARGKQLFPEGDDQHLNGTGYGVVARAIADYLGIGISDSSHDEGQADKDR